MSNPIPYESLYFGKSDARNELNENPEDFVRSFVNLSGVTQDVVDGKKTILLGPKGTGKSTVGWYLQTTGGQGGHLAEVRDASTLPLAEIPHLETGQPASVERTVSAWQFILLCNYLDLLQKDQACVLPNLTEIKRVTRLLKQYGFMGDVSGRALLKISSTTVSIPLPKIGNIYKKESRDSLSIFNLIPYMVDWSMKAQSPNRHILLLDGLDSIFLNDEKYNESLSSLVQAAYSLNQQLSFGGATGSVVLMLRNDVFSRISLSLPDSQKMRDDFGVELDWRVLKGAPSERAPLITLVNKKAAQDLDIESINVLDYFPRDIQIGGHGGSAPRWQPRLQYLLNLTRHTPRDLLRLFEEIRKVQASGIFDSSSNILSHEVIREGVLKYSNNYFVGAIRNEFAGAEGGVGASQAAVAALQSMAKQKFTAEEFRSALDNVDKEFTASSNKLLTLLFYAGAIGNLVPGRNKSYVQFFHRRDAADIYHKGPLVLHNTLAHAWAIPFST